MIRVMLVDDQARELEGMRSIIRWEEMDMQVVQTAADARDALAYARQNRRGPGHHGCDDAGHGRAGTDGGIARAFSLDEGDLR